MVAGDLLRLAWEAEHDGRTRLRDTLLTMAVTESEPGDQWAEPCRDRLVRDRPDHFLAHFASVSLALADPRVIDARDRLRIKYPTPRVQSLLLRAQTRRGPYLGRSESLDAMVEDLVGFTAAEAENVRLDAPQPSRGPLIRQKSAKAVAWSLNFPPLERPNGSSLLDSEPEAPSDWDRVDANASAEQDFLIEYSTVLLAIAFLMASVQQGREAA
jgi:hypothetical protein